MIQQTTFLGISLRTTAHRRALVLAYYALLLAILGIFLWKQRFIAGGIFIQTLTLGGFFGGIRAGGVIKPYSDSIPDPTSSGVQQLNLNGVFPQQRVRLLDERELHARDRAHYIAYRILRWTVCLAGAAIVCGMSFAPGFLMKNSPNLLWALVVFVLSLPQSVILWTEPEPLPDTTLTLVLTT